MGARDFTLTLKGATAQVGVVTLHAQPDGSMKMTVQGAVADAKGVGHQLGSVSVELPADSAVIRDVKAFALVALRRANHLETDEKPKRKRR